MSDLLINFYTVKESNTLEEGKATWIIEINPKHEIFEGHFPGNPITPGVSMIQIIKEISQNLLGKQLFLESADNVKFMAIINPEETPVVKLDFTIDAKEDKWKVKTTASFGETVALKFSGTFKVIG